MPRIDICILYDEAEDGTKLLRDLSIDYRRDTANTAILLIADLDRNARQHKRDLNKTKKAEPEALPATEKDDSA